jgi:hypothetical protein
MILCANNKIVHNYRNFFEEENIMHTSNHVGNLKIMGKLS